MFSCKNRFDCFYVNKPCYCLRPISCITPFPHFSCPPFPHFSCSPSFSCPPSCNPMFMHPCDEFHQNFCQPQNPCFNRPSFSHCQPNMNLMWFLGGFNCGKNRCRNNCPRNFEYINFSY